MKAYGNNCSNNPAAIIHLLLLLVLLSTEKKFSHRNCLLFLNGLDSISHQFFV